MPSLKNQIDEYLDDIKLEYDEYKQEVFKIYDMFSFEEAVDYAIDLRNRVNEYPESICTYIPWANKVQITIKIHIMLVRMIPWTNALYALS